MENIFNYIKEDDNNNLFHINNLDIREILSLINNYDLYLRRTLLLPKDITFGIEIEFENADRFAINSDLKNIFKDERYITKNDGSLNNGGEIATPILYDENKYYQDIKILCDCIKKRNGEATETTGGHVHIGTNIIGMDGNKWYEFLITWITYENILIRFFNGEYLNSRKKLNRYANPLGNRLLTKINKKEKEFTGTLEPWFIRILNLLENDDDENSNSRYQAINFNNIKNDQSVVEGNTIELRCPSGTLDPVIWQNYVNVITKLLLKSGNIDMDIVKRRLIKTKATLDNLKLYQDIYIKEALEFADLIFDNNLDKVYFLRQYFKGFEYSNKFEKAKIFTK